MQKEIGNNVTYDKIREYVWKTLRSGQVIPGYVIPPPSFLGPSLSVRDGRYGHGVLRNPDPRFMALQQFCDAQPELNSSPIIQMVKKVRTAGYLFVC